MGNAESGQRIPERIEHNPVDSLADDELAAELTIAAHDPVRRVQRYEALWTELINRRRGQAGRSRPNVAPS